MSAKPKASTKSSKTREASQSPSSRSETGEKGKPASEARQKTFSKRFDFNSEEHKLPLKKSLKQGDFKKLIRTIKQDVHNLHQVTAYTYGTGDYTPANPKLYTPWTKKYSREVLRQVLRRLDKIPEYHHVKRAGGPGGGQLQRPFFVFQPFHDWVNEVNMGNGLAGLLVHMYKKYNKKDPTKFDWQASYQAFLDYANDSGKLSKPITHKEVVEDLLYVHAPGRRETATNGDVQGVNNFYFQLMNTKDGQVIDPADPVITRIVEVRNAYVSGYNKNRPKGEEALKPINAARAVAMCVPQEATIADSNGVPMETSSILDANITIRGSKLTYKSSAINSGMSTAILALMTNANLIPKSENDDNARSRGYIQYDLFAKYFHNRATITVGGKNRPNENHVPGYQPGVDAKYYLGNKSTDLGLDLSDLDEATLRTVISNAFPSTATGKKSDSNSPLGKIAHRVSRAYGDKPPTIFELISEMKSGKGGGGSTKSFLERTTEDAPYGITNFAATQLAFLSKIPREFLSAETQAIIKTEDLYKQVKEVQRYLSNINKAYSAYRVSPSKRSAATPSKAASPRKPKSKSKSASASGQSDEDEPEEVEAEEAEGDAPEEEEEVPASAGASTKAKQKPSVTAPEEEEDE